MLYRVHVEQIWWQDVTVEAEDEMEALRLAEEGYDHSKAVGEAPVALSAAIERGTPERDINYDDQYK